MASVTWALAGVDFDVDDGFCHTAHWTVTRVDGDYTASSYGSSALTKPSSLFLRILFISGIAGEYLSMCATAKFLFEFLLLT